MGDEIVLCSRIKSREHLSKTIEAFRDATAEYHREILKAKGQKLGLKSAAWVAAFPGHNLTIPIDIQADSSERSETEELEQDADNFPRKYDFLGRAIDTGFRLTKHASSARCAISVQLAYLLCDKNLERSSSVVIEYFGREPLKGVNAEFPYPILAVRTESDDAMEDLLHAENHLLKNFSEDSKDIRAFCEKFMTVTKIETPILPEQVTENSLPASYRSYKRTWESETEEILHQNKEIEAAAEKSNDYDQKEIPNSVSEALALVLVRAALGASILVASMEGKNVIFFLGF